MARSLLVPLSLSGLLSVVVGPVVTQPGVVDWVAEGRNPSPQAALQFLHSQPGRLQVQWRAVGAREWEGGLTGWDVSRDGLGATGTGDGLATASLRAAAWRGSLRLRLTLTAVRATTQPTEIVVRCPFEPSAWRRQFYPRLPYLQLPPEAPAMLRFAADATDATTPADAPQVAFYPFGVLENDRAFLLWGCPDVGRYAVLSPNAVTPGVPCLSLRPKRLAVGQQLDFDLVLKRFDKPEFRYRDVLAWYLRSAVSSDPLVRDLFPWDGRRRARPLPVGNLGSGLGRLARPDTDGARLLDELRQRHVSALWFQGWGPWDETFPTEGAWFTEYWSRFSAAQVRDEIAWERRNRLFPLLYCRQFLAEQGLHDDRPPLRDWVGRDENGNRQAWGDWPVPDQAAAEVGFRVMQQSCADFGNNAFRAWYEGRIKACLDYYQPAGIAWDMGWGAGHTWGYSRANPRTPNGDGMLRAQANLWAWLHAKHPEMRTIANEAMGTPSQMFADGILVEGGFAAGKTELDYEAAKALGTTVISYEYPSGYAARLRGLPTGSARYLQLRYRAVGVDTTAGRYVVYPSQEIVGREGPAITCNQLQADGEWHVATFDMRGLPTIDEVKGLAFGMDAGAEEAHLWVDYLRFSATPDGPALPVGPDSFPPSITGADVAAWEARPGWVTNPAVEYEVRRDQGALEFTVRGARRGMSWSFFPACGDLAQEYLRVLSLGACVGSGLRAEWEALNAFSAQAMALPPLVGSHDLTLEPEASGATASAWGGGGHLLLAVHNGGPEARLLNLEVSAEALARADVSLGPGTVSWVLDRTAQPSRPGPAAAVANSGGLRLSVRLAPGEALLWGNWGWPGGDRRLLGTP